MALEHAVHSSPGPSAGPSNLHPKSHRNLKFSLTASRRQRSRPTSMAMEAAFPIASPAFSLAHSLAQHVSAAVQSVQSFAVAVSPKPEVDEQQIDHSYRLPFMAHKEPSKMPPEERAEYDMEVAEKAVQLACWLTQRVQAQLRKQEEAAQAKPDKSFVTVADYGVQAVVSWLLSQAYPGEAISMIAEEDAKDLTGEANVGTLQRLVAVVNECLQQAPTLGIPSPTKPLTAVEILAGISKGSSPGGPVGRHWVLDPVDGTLGFVRQDQYAVALALVEDGALTLGVLGCPNFPTRAGWLRHPNRYLRLAEKYFPPEEDSWTRGVVMKAQRGKGASMGPLLLGHGVDEEEEDEEEEEAAEARGARGGNGALKGAVEVRVSPVQDPMAAVFCEPVEKANSNQGLTGELAANLGMKSEALRMYSMAKYAAVARGDAEIFMKFAKASYREKVWDHAAGVIIVEEAGGVVTDAGGNPLDFSRGRFLEGLDRGIVATNGPELHGKLLMAVEDSWGSAKL